MTIEAFPIFLAIEINELEEPLAIAWSQTHQNWFESLISPFDVAEEESSRLVDHAYEYAYARTPREIVQLMKADIASDILYINGIEDDESSLQKLFDQAEQSNFFELKFAWELYPCLSRSEWFGERERLMSEYELVPRHAAAEVETMIRLHQLFGEQ